jgi:phage head maturation protease
MNIFAEICKVNDEERMVYGYASTEALDVQGERVSKDALKAALPEYMKFANIREMHTASAVGVAKSAEIDAKGLYLAAKVVDDDAWNKVKEGVYKGFSIGGKAVSKVDETITEMRLSEISLVDRPANPEAVIDIWKADGAEAPAAIDALAELLNKGDISPERLLELAKSDKEQAPAAPVTPEPAADTPAADVAKGYEGEEIYDAATALSALDSIMYLLQKERTEGEDMPEQVAALETACAALKTFVQSEIQEDNSPASQAAEAMEEAAESMVAMADQGGDIEKVGKEISSKNMAKVQAVHDSVVAMGAMCAKAEKADSEADIAKADAISKLVEDAIAKAVAPLKDELTKANAEIERMKSMPLPGKALLKAVAKADDVVANNESGSAAPMVKDGAGNPNEVASLIKMIHQQGGVR